MIRQPHEIARDKFFAEEAHFFVMKNKPQALFRLFDRLSEPADHFSVLSGVSWGSRMLLNKHFDVRAKGFEQYIALYGAVTNSLKSNPHHQPIAGAFDSGLADTTRWLCYSSASPTGEFQLLVNASLRFSSGEVRKAMARVILDTSGRALERMIEAHPSSTFAGYIVRDLSDRLKSAIGTKTGLAQPA